MPKARTRTVSTWSIKLRKTAPGAAGGMVYRNITGPVVVNDCFESWITWSAA